MITLHLLLYRLTKIHNKRVWEIDNSQLDQILSRFQTLVKQDLFNDQEFVQEIGNAESQIHRMLAIVAYLNKLEIVRQLLFFKPIAKNAAFNNNEAVQAAFYPFLPRLLKPDADCGVGLPRLAIIQRLQNEPSVKNLLMAGLELNQGITVQYMVYWLQAIQNKSLWHIQTRDFNIIKDSIIAFVSQQGLLSDEFKKLVADREHPLHRLLAIVSYVGDVKLVEELLSILEIKENAAFNHNEALRAAVYPNPSQLGTPQTLTLIQHNNHPSSLLTFKEYLEREQRQNQEEVNSLFMLANHNDRIIRAINNDNNEDFLNLLLNSHILDFESMQTGSAPVLFDRVTETAAAERKSAFDSVWDSDEENSGETFLAIAAMNNSDSEEQKKRGENEGRAKCLNPDTYRNNSAVIARLLDEKIVREALFSVPSPRRDLALRNALSSLCIDSVMSIVKAYVQHNKPLPLIKPLIQFFERLNLCHIRFLSQLERHFVGHVPCVGKQSVRMVLFERELFYSHLLPYLQDARTKQDADWLKHPFDSTPSREPQQSQFLLHIFNPDRELNPPYQRVFQMIKKIRENKTKPDVLAEMGEVFGRINRLDAYQYLVCCAGIYSHGDSQAVVRRSAQLSYESLNEAIEAYHKALLAPAAETSSSSTSLIGKSRPRMN